MSNIPFQQFFERIANSLGSKFKPEIRYHLAKTYLCLGGSTAAAAVGSLLHISEWLQLELIAALCSIALILGLIFLQANGKNFYTRLGMLFGFGFCSGHSLGPLLEHVIMLNPAIVVTAFTGTSVIFLTLTMAALLSERGSYLFLGGILVSILNTMSLLSLLNIFMRSYFIVQVHLYVGLVVMSAFILYKTQTIIEKACLGNRDYIRDSLHLFMDVLSIFEKLLIMLTKKKEENIEKNKCKRNQISMSFKL